MTADVSEPVRVLRSCIGNRLDSMDADVHVHQTRPTPTILLAALGFGGVIVRTGTASNGGLHLADQIPVTDMGAFGRTGRHAMSPSTIGQQLRGVRRLLSAEFGPQDEPVGLALAFDSGEIWIWNQGDDLVVAEARTGLPPTSVVRLE